MKKRSLYLIPLILALIFSLFLSACGGKNEDLSQERDSGKNNDMFLYSSKTEQGIKESLDAENELTESKLNIGVTDPSRKLIYHVNYEIETKKYDESVDTIHTIVTELGGYIESMKTSGENGSSRYSTFALRIPSDKLQAFIDRSGNIGSVASESLSTDDVTLSYSDLEAKLDSLKAEETALTAMLEKAKSIDEMLSVQKYLTDVRYEIESYGRQLNTMASLVSYASVNLRLYEVIDYTYTPTSFGERLSEQFHDSLDRISSAAEDFGIWFLGNIFEILFWLVFIAAIVFVHILIIRAIVRKARKKRTASLN